MAVTTGAGTFETFGDFEKVAHFFTTYDSAWDVVFSIIGPIHSLMNQYFGVIAFATALLALAYYAVRFEIEEIGRFIIPFFFAAFMFYPATNVPNPVGGQWTIGGSDIEQKMNDSTKKSAGSGTASGSSAIRPSAVLYYLNKLTDAVLRDMETIVDSGIKSLGPPGDFRAPMGAMAAMNQPFPDQLRDSRLKHVYQDYLRNCSYLAQNMSGEDAVSVAIMGGELGNSGPLVRKPAQNALKILKEAYPKGGAYISPDGYMIEEADYWMNRLNRNSSEAGRLVKRAYVKNTEYKDLQYNIGDGGASVAVELDPNQVFRFYARSCGDLYTIADLGMQQYVKAETKYFTPSLTEAFTNGHGPWHLMPGQLASIVSARAQDHIQNTMDTDSADTVGDSSSMWKALTHAITNSIWGGGSTLLAWYKSRDFVYFSVLAPAISAATVGVIFVIFPFSVALTLLPGRSSLLYNLFFGILFVKMTVFFSYLVTKIGGLLTTAALQVSLNATQNLGTNLSTSIDAWVIGGEILTYMAAIAGAPVMAYMLVFNESSGLRGMAFNKHGAHHIDEALAAAGAAGMKLIKMGSEKNSPPQKSTRGESISGSSSPSWQMRESISSSSGLSSKVPGEMVKDESATLSSVLKRLNK